MISGESNRQPRCSRTRGDSRWIKSAGSASRCNRARNTADCPTQDALRSAAEARRDTPRQDVRIVAWQRDGANAGWNVDSKPGLSIIVKNKDSIKASVECAWTLQCRECGCLAACYQLSWTTCRTRLSSKKRAAPKEELESTRKGTT